MDWIKIIILAFIQGMAELLPISSSAHVIVSEKLMGLNPSSPEMTFLLVMLHTGTMFAVLLYFRPRWFAMWRSSMEERKEFLYNLVIATAATGVLGLGLKKIIEKIFLHDHEQADIEMLFGNLKLIAASLFAAGIFIFIAGSKKEDEKNSPVNKFSAFWIGAIQGLCLPFRGFSRSGATISVGILTGVSKAMAENFSFALAVILTPPVVARELHRLLKHHEGVAASFSLHQILLPGFVGMLFSFLAGLLALRWLSFWIESGRWKWFSYYCFFAATGVFFLSFYY